ncbi:hypothetical protein D3C79_1045640 [compost metagenome]
MCCDFAQGLLTKCIAKLARFNLMIATLPYPGIHLVAKTCLFELVEQATKTTTERAGCCRSRRCAAACKRSTKQATKAT